MKRAMIAGAAVLVYSCAYAQPTGTLEKIKERHEITLGVKETALPFSYLDKNQKFVGYSVDLCMRVADKLKVALDIPDLKVKLVPVTSSSRIPLIANGTVDLECGTTSNTLERQQQVSFSITTFVSSTRFVSKKQLHLAKLNDLRNKPVVATSGSSNMRQITKINASQNYGMRISPVRDFTEGFLMVRTGRASAFFLDDITLSGLVANSKTPSDYVISADPLSVEPYALMMRKDDPRFKNFVDDVLKATFKSGDIAGIYKKWFESPIPPKGINMDVPMSSALKRAIANPTDSTKASAYQ